MIVMVFLKQTFDEKKRLEANIFALRGFYHPAHVLPHKSFRTLTRL